MLKKIAQNSEGHTTAGAEVLESDRQEFFVYQDGRKQK